MTATSYMMQSIRLGLPLLALCFVSTCGGDGRPAPKDTVLDLFTAIQKSDTTRLTEIIDLESAAHSIRNEFQFIFDDTTGGDTALGPPLLASLTGEGFLRQRWTDDQKVLGAVTIEGDTALVEVSFIDRVTRVQYYNKMRLVYREPHWVITAFRTL